MGDWNRGNLVTVALQHVAGLKLDQPQVEGHSPGSPQRKHHQLAQALGSVDRERPLAPTKVERLQKSGQAKPVIGMEVSQEYLCQLGQANRADELSLGALTAVDEDPVAATTHEHRRQPASRRRNGTASPDKKHR